MSSDIQEEKPPHGRITVHLKEELLRAFYAKCMQRGVSMSKMLRQLIEQYIDEEEFLDE